MPLNELAVPNRLVGTRSVRKALQSGVLRKVFLAADARGSLVKDLERMARESGVKVEWADSTAILGRACAIDRGAAAAGIVIRKGPPITGAEDAKSNE